MSYREVLLFVVILFSVCAVEALYVPVMPNMRSFSSAIKGGHINASEEKVLYKRNTDTPGVVTEQWFTGEGVMNENMTIRIYIDGETIAGLEFQLLLAHGIGFTDREDEKGRIPWGTTRIAHDADGSVYNTYRIPFMKSIKVTATHPVGGRFWYIIRGVENYPLIMGSLLLPKTTRLRLYKNEQVTLKPLEFLTLANIAKTAGAIYQVTLAVESNSSSYLEACMRAKIDGSPDYTWLSSGTEDFFLSAYYFNEGVYHLPNAGLTYKKNGTMSAYKFFEDDPLLFTSSFELIWRCGEQFDPPDEGGCPSDFPPPVHEGYGRMRRDYKPTDTLQPIKATTYTWVYEWQQT